MERNSLKPLFRFPGGKQTELKHYIEFVPQPNSVEGFYTYVEPFVGGGATFFALNHGKQNVIADTDPQIINFYEQIQKGQGLVLHSLVQDVPNPKKIISMFETVWIQDHRICLMPFNFIIFDKHAFEVSIREIGVDISTLLGTPQIIRRSTATSCWIRHIRNFNKAPTFCCNPLNKPWPIKMIARLSVSWTLLIQGKITILPILTQKSTNALLICSAKRTVNACWSLKIPSWFESCITTTSLAVILKHIIWNEITRFGAPNISS